MSVKYDGDDARRYAEPYSGNRPVPTISKYREELEARREEAMLNGEPAASLPDGSGVVDDATSSELRPSRSSQRPSSSTGQASQKSAA